MESFLFQIDKLMVMAFRALNLSTEKHTRGFRGQASFYRLMKANKIAAGFSPTLPPAVMI